MLFIYIKNNIDSDGYIYEYSTVNATSPYGPVPDAKGNRLVTEIEVYHIGSYYLLSEENNKTFKNITSLFSRDFVQGLLALQDLYKITNNAVYKNAIDRTINYYIERLPEDKTDFLFVSHFNEENEIPKDTLAAIKAITFFKETDKDTYYQNLRAILSSKYFRCSVSKS